MERITTELIIISVGQSGVNSKMVKDVKTDTTFNLKRVLLDFLILSAMHPS
jgi:hypothetical protein